MKELKKGWRELFEPVHRLLDIAMAAGKFEYAAGISDAMDVLETTIRYIEMFGEEVDLLPVPELTSKLLNTMPEGVADEIDYYDEAMKYAREKMKTQPVYTDKTWPHECGHNIIHYGPAYECDTCGRKIPEKCEWRKLALDYLESLEGAK